ncbi:MAG: pyridoxamine 5'-phosphate oxidase family protein [Gammaproteobacteria bacterium]|nr:pyridoxamine 5'-phosphate oxidase family protein [Gammaproteobacteria bacterium]
MASDPSNPTNDSTSPFHAGERELQTRAGVRDRIEQIGRRVLRDHLIDQHREFFALLPTLILSGLDAAEQPWATMLAGPPGFVNSPDVRSLRVEAVRAPQDPALAELALGAPVGLLGLQAHTRRRNRLNGVVTALDDAGFAIAVRQSFGNCPKYILGREPERRMATSETPAVHGGKILDAVARRLIANADTFFVASRSPAPKDSRQAQGLDVSHRGGKPGFVRIDDEREASVVTIPDFVGNDYFNTLGNLLLAPACGLLFVDYATGGLLHLAGDGELLWSGADLEAYAGAQRFWRFHVRASVWRPGVLPYRWTTPDLAPQLVETGNWL